MTALVEENAALHNERVMNRQAMQQQQEVRAAMLVFSMACNNHEHADRQTCFTFARGHHMTYMRRTAGPGQDDCCDCCYELFFQSVMAAKVSF